MEYSATLEMLKERRYVVDELWDRLRIVYGRVDAVRRNIDESLATEDSLHRQCGMMEFRSPCRFPDPTEMENSTASTWIQWISREVNELCNELTQVIDQEMNKTLSEFRPIPEDVEPEGEAQPDLMGFKTPQPGNEVGVWGKEGNSPQQGLHEHQPQPQTEDLNITQINIHQTTEIAINDIQGTEENNEHHRTQPAETISENIQEQTGQASHNHTDGNARDTIESNAGNTVNINLNNNRYNTESNSTNILPIPEYRSGNSQNYFRMNTQQNINIPQHTAPSQNRNEFSENS